MGGKWTVMGKTHKECKERNNSIAIKLGYKKYYNKSKRLKNAIQTCQRNNIPYELYKNYIRHKLIIKPLKVLIAIKLSSIKARCRYKQCHKYEYYGGRGIKCFITMNELEFLWHRDYAANMAQPSIDRINPDDHYKYSNCRFIEMSENRKWRNQLKYSVNKP